MAREYSEQLGPDKLIEMFGTYNSWEGLFYYLGAILTKTEDKEVHFKYIEAAAKVGNLQEVERVTREDNFYDPERVRPHRPQPSRARPGPSRAQRSPRRLRRMQYGAFGRLLPHRTPAPHNPPPNPPPRLLSFAGARLPQGRAAARPAPPDQRVRPS